jgi:hypothetical protein
VHLYTAHETLTAIGAEAFAERARRELLATGEKVRTRSVETRDELTAQEMQNRCDGCGGTAERDEEGDACVADPVAQPAECCGDPPRSRFRLVLIWLGTPFGPGRSRDVPHRRPPRTSRGWGGYAIALP